MSTLWHAAWFASLADPGTQLPEMPPPRDPSDALDQLVTCLNATGWLRARLCFHCPQRSFPNGTTHLVLLPRLRWDHGDILSFDLTPAGYALTKGGPPAGLAEWIHHLGGPIRHTIARHRELFEALHRTRAPVLTGMEEDPAPFIVDAPEHRRWMEAVREGRPAAEIFARVSARSARTPPSGRMWSLAGVEGAWVRLPAPGVRLGVEAHRAMSASPAHAIASAREAFDRFGQPDLLDPGWPERFDRLHHGLAARAEPTSSWLGDLVRWMADPEDDRGEVVWTGPHTADPYGVAGFLGDAVRSLETLSWVKARLRRPAPRTLKLSLQPKHLWQGGWAQIFGEGTPEGDSPAGAARALGRMACEVTRFREQYVAYDETVVPLRIGRASVGRVDPEVRRAVFDAAMTRSDPVRFFVMAPPETPTPLAGTVVRLGGLPIEVARTERSGSGFVVEGRAGNPRAAGCCDC